MEGRLECASAPEFHGVSNCRNFSEEGQGRDRRWLTVHEESSLHHAGFLPSPIERLRGRQNLESFPAITALEEQCQGAVIGIWNLGRISDVPAATDLKNLRAPARFGETVELGATAG